MKLNFVFLISLFIFLFFSYTTEAYFGCNCQYPNNHYVPWYLSGNVENRLTFLERQTSQKINMLIARIEALERELGLIHRISMQEWNNSGAGNIYKIFNTSKTWEEAKNTCMTFGARLASIDSDYKNAFVRNMIERSFGKDGSAEVWIGLKTRAELTNNPNSHFTNFGEEEKIDGCAVMGIKGKWKIRSCSNLQPFVCEQILM
uniref:C-type lectin domain-containing protein n=1 Tax=Meloidogyne incognita TaxID=6306 RepID=A0A914L6S7_MELIC